MRNVIARTVHEIDARVLQANSPLQVPTDVLAGDGRKIALGRLPNENSLSLSQGLLLREIRGGWRVFYLEHSEEMEREQISIAKNPLNSLSARIDRGSKPTFNCWFSEIAQAVRIEWSIWFWREKGEIWKPVRAVEDLRGAAIEAGVDDSSIEALPPVRAPLGRRNC